MTKISHFIYTHAADPQVTTGLLVAGFVPNFFSLDKLQLLYFMLILPPAAFHAAVWIWKEILKPAWRWFNDIKF